MNRPRFLLDENVERFVIAAAWRLDPSLSLLRLGDKGAPPLGSTDREILEFCSRESYILLTRDRATIPGEVTSILGEGRHLPGVFILRRKGTVADLVADLILLDATYSHAEWQDRIVYLPL